MAIEHPPDDAIVRQYMEPIITDAQQASCEHDWEFLRVVVTGIGRKGDLFYCRQCLAQKSIEQTQTPRRSPSIKTERGKKF